MFAALMHHLSVPVPPVWYWKPPINLTPPPLPHPFVLSHFFRR